MEREEACSASHAAHSSILAIAGAYTGPLLEHLYGKGQKTCDMEDIYEALNALYETNRVEEAMGLIRGLFAIGEMDYPYPLEALERFRSAREAFFSHSRSMPGSARILFRISFPFSAPVSLCRQVSLKACLRSGGIRLSLYSCCKRNRS